MPKIRENGDDSGSSDHEIINKALLEDTDSPLFRKSMFDRQTSAESPNTKYNDVKKNDEFGVSEAFENSVAERLTELLDRNIEMTEKTISSKHSRKRRKIDHEELDGGIRLLRTSGSFLTSVDMNASSHDSTSKSRKKTVKNMTSRDNLLRCKEAAIDPQWLLSKVETKFWSNRQKGTVYEYQKLPDGTLIEK